MNVPTLSKYSCLLAIIFLFTACSESEPPASSEPAKLTKVTIAETGSSPPALLLYVAQQQGFYEDEGLEVDIVTRYGHGKANIDAMLAGKVDVCTASETPVMRAGLAGNPVRVLATIGSADRHLAIVGRADSGIDNAGDLANKRLGVTEGSNAEFFFDAFLQMRGLSQLLVEKVHRKPKALPEAIKAGDVDAIVSWFPNWKRAEDELGDNARVFFGEGVYTMFFNLLANERFLAERPKDTAALLRALVKAERYVQQHPDAALAIFQKQFDLDLVTAQKVFGNYQFGVSLSQELLLTLESQARWAMRKGLTEQTRMPNYLKYIHLEALDHVEPMAVDVIR